MPFITNKTLPRRTFLRGVGATVALPLLESMLPAVSSTARAEELTPTRFTGIFVPHGAAPGYWVPEGNAKGFAFPYLWKPLEPFRKHVVLTSGLWAKSSENPPGVTGADHFVASAFLCGVKPRKTTGADVEAGITVDQAIAQHIGQETLLPSLQLAVEDPGANASNCGEGYSCVYTNTISWQTPVRPLPMQVNPQVVFERLFGEGGTAEARLARREQQRSILDSVTGSLRRLGAEVGHGDRVRVDQYLSDVREIERRLQIAMQASNDTPAIPIPYGIPDSFDEHIKLQFDLLALAFQADLSRVGTLLYARDLTGRVYPDSGTDISFHGGSHHAEDPGRIAQYAQLNQYHVKTLAYFIEKLKSIPEGDGTLLDHSLTLYGSNMGNSNQHLHYDVPHVLIGGASGRIKGDRHLAFPSRTVPSGNLLLSLLDVYGIHEESFGDSTGRIEGLVS
ncbi:MAG TPA: DUF1552 domain-containing protein [Gammaproteobacteria bacterium]|nr:DUF1552 domain-containing protein [Gammaproteobacteria bacterium]